MGNCLAPPVKSHSSPSTGYSSPGRSKTSSSNSSANTTAKLPSTSNRTSGESAASSYEVYPEGRILVVPNLRVFTFTELKSATKNFKPDMILGQGGFGIVYKGWIDEKGSGSKSGSGTVVAVKKLHPESMQGFEEWQCEVNFLGRLSHPNLVKLLGYCWEDKELLLVYEFMARGSLENHLFKKSVQSLSWSLRIKIAIQAAKGLAFLHASEKKIIYRDFKASNILLDSDYNPKLSDFGLAKNGPTGADSHVTTRIIGTSGYAAPEYVATGHLYVKSDVYGFGVVLLEMISGQRAIDPNRPNGQQKLVEWSKPYLEDRRKLNRLMDPRLEGQYQSKCAFQAAQLSLRCLAEEPKKRPSMKEVVETLEKIANSNVKISQNRQPLVHPRRGNVGSEARARR